MKMRLKAIKRQKTKLFSMWLIHYRRRFGKISTNKTKGTNNEND